MFDALQAPPEGVTHAEALLDSLDACFLNGFARLGDAEAASLASLAKTFTGTPLAAPVAAAAEALAAGDYGITHFEALAAARGSLQGAIHDALVQQVRAALGRAAPEAAPAAAPAEPFPPQMAPLLESTQQWLMELALAGFGQLDYGTVVPFAATLEKLQAEPELTRLSVLLTGTLGEIAAALPIEDAAALPLSRWVDLWSRAMLGTLGAPASPGGEAFSGNVRILGAALNTHANAVSVTAWGVVEGDTPRMVRVSRTAWKVDQVFDAATWQALGDGDDPLMRAIGERRILRVSDATLLPSGDLVLEGAKVGESMAAFSWSEAAPAAAVGEALPGPVAAPADRHPVQIAEPVYLSELEATSARKGDQTVTVGGGSLPVAVDRMGYRGAHLNAALSNAACAFGLLRYDGGAWSFQPLALQTNIKGNKTVDFYNGDDAMASIKSAGSSNLGILRERASKILRAQS